MFEESEVEEEFVNLPNRYLLLFGNTIFNLEDVSEILRHPELKHEIIFIFKNGRERKFSYNSRTDHSFALRCLDHSIRKNLFDFKLTADCHRKWDNYRREEVDRGER